MKYKITTDANGVLSLSFSAKQTTGRLGGMSVQWRVKDSNTTDFTGMTDCSMTDPMRLPITYSGTLTVKLLPNSTYYVDFYSADAHGDLYGFTSTFGAATLTASGNWGPAAGVTANNANFGSAVSISYGASVSGATYTVTAKVGTSAAETLQTKGTASSRSWTPSLATYASSYPNQKTVSCVITVSTYYGNELAGTNTKTITLTMTQAQVGPSITDAVFTIAPVNAGAISGLSGYIQGYSKIRATFASSGVTLKNGATISKWTVKFGSAAAADVAASTTTKDSAAISATTTVVCTVVDSRGYTASKTLTATITPYQQPTLTATATRCDGSGNATDSGTYVKIALKLTYASISGQNAATAKAYKKLVSATSYGSATTITGGTTTSSGTNKVYNVTSFLLSGFADAGYDIKIEGTDSLGNKATIVTTITSQKWAIHFRNKGAGAAVGKAAEADKQFQIPADWDYYKGTTKLGTILDAYPVGSIYMSVNSTNPQTLFGGTWERITGKFLLAATDNGSSGASQAAGRTGGAASVTLATGNLPSHKHSVGAHAHGLNEHVHSVGAHSHGLNSHTHSVPALSGTAASNGSHRHKIYFAPRASGYTNAAFGYYYQANGSVAKSDAEADCGIIAGGAHTHTVTTVANTTGQASGSTANSTAFNSGKASGSTANSTAFDSGATGSGTAFSIVPPFLSVYIWKRTA